MNLLKMFEKKPIVFDGAMGTSLAVARKSKHKEKIDLRLVCSEAYNLHAPEIVEAVHSGFVDAGCDVIETNTFNGNRLSLAEYGLESKVRDINLRAASIAKSVADAAGRKIFVSGDLGPTGKLPSMGQISFDEMYGAYAEQAEILIAAGIDLIQIDTCQDTLQVKAAVIACNDVMRKVGRNLPVIVTVTIDSAGRMLLGTEIDAVIATLIPLNVSAIGLNCGMGPKGMEETVRYLVHHSPLPILVMPNAGLPEIVDGETHYNLEPEEFSDLLEYFVVELGVEMVGGCCGTTYEHMSAVVRRLKGIKPKKRKIEWSPRLSGLFSATTIRQNPAPLIVGERMNINGSKKFRKYILVDDFESASSMVADQEGVGAHVLDLSVAYAGRDEVQDFREMLKRVIGKAHAPLCIDSTNIQAVGAACKLIPGRPVINSINLEDGGEKAKKVLELAGRFGAALIALTIDEDGMARETDKKCKIADRIIKLCEEYGVDEPSLFIDFLTFTLAEPRAASFGSGAKTLEAIAKIKKRHPKINTILGVSNVSYGFGKAARRVLNSVFLHEALKKGLDAAIVHAGQILPLSNLDDGTIGIAEDLIWNRKEDALDRFIRHFEGKDVAVEEMSDQVSPEEGVRLSILRGDRVKIKTFLDELIKERDAKAILDRILLPAMADVGGLFDRGKIPLPFVLQSAEVMKVATDHLSAHFEVKEGLKKGRVVLATVRGDVHDIGKNLVDIVLSNNGFDVINLGVKQSAENIRSAAMENGADVIGLSGLLVESVLIMKDDLAWFSRNGIRIPVVCGGAALTKKFVEKELTAAYGGPVYYAKDAFDGLKIVEKIVRS